MSEKNFPAEKFNPPVNGLKKEIFSFVRVAVNALIFSVIFGQFGLRGLGFGVSVLPPQTEPSPSTVVSRGRKRSRNRQGQEQQVFGQQRMFRSLTESGSQNQQENQEQQKIDEKSVPLVETTAHHLSKSASIQESESPFSQAGKFAWNKIFWPALRKYLKTLVYTGLEKKVYSPKSAATHIHTHTHTKTTNNVRNNITVEAQSVTVSQEALVDPIFTIEDITSRQTNTNVDPRSST